MKRISKLMLFSGLGVIAVVLSSFPRDGAAAGPFPPVNPPFKSTCLSGRYAAAGSGIDVFFGNPFAAAGYVQLTCTKAGATGTYTGMLTITYPTSNSSLTTPGAEVEAFTCTLTNGLYTLDPSTGAITATATIGGCELFATPVTYNQSGYVSDPSGHQIYVVSTYYSDIFPLVFTKYP